MPFPRKKIAVSLLPQQLREHSYAVIYPPGNRIIDLYIMPDAMLGGIQSGKKVALEGQQWGDGQKASSSTTADRQNSSIFGVSAI